ncbi:CamS family sex pheromone protein [Fructilactobacillus florum]|uniref:CamS family sex pheromone protein n=1 Tax=Fructilactobacillus florum TaxID=640331 RepID=UPI000A985A0E
MKRRISILAIAAASTVLLVGCGNRNKISTNSGSQKTQLTGSNSNNDYQSLIKDGHYQVSKAAGINGQQTSNQFNLQGFQRGLLEISKQNFSPDKYIFQEGQQLSATTVQNWVGRKTDDNPDGLNPNQPKDKVVPEYLQQIEEQDFLQTVDGKTELKGMTIGVGLNSVYYYTKEKYGAQYSKNLTDAEIESNGKEIANQILARLRKQADLKKHSNCGGSVQSGPR